MDSIIGEVQSLLLLAIAAESADKGNVQQFDPDSAELRIVAQSGFSEQFLEHFEIVKPFDTTSCGRAVGLGNVVAVDDVELDWGFQRHIKVIRAEGYRSVRSTPIRTEQGTVLGVISTHFREPKTIWPPSKLQTLLPQLVTLLASLRLVHS